MSNISRQEEVEQQYHHLFQIGAFAQALELATHAYTDLEHAFPLDFERKLPEALDYVVSGG